MQFKCTPQWLCAWAIAGWVACCAVGCAPLRPPGKSPLSPLAMLPECVQIEKYTVRYDDADPALNDLMWAEIDEQCLPPDLRARLAANGLRAGVIGANIPPSLMKVLLDNPTSAVAEDAYSDGPSLDTLALAKPVDGLSEAKVRRGLLQSRAGHTSRILVLGEQARIPQLPLLIHDDSGRVTGRPYEKALGLLSLVTQPERDGRVRVDMTPELEYGEPQQRYTAGDGMFRLDYRPETKVFNELKINVAISSGEMLVIAGRADMPGSLGHHYFTDRASGQPSEQKLLLLRVTHTPGDDVFRSGEPRPAS